MDSPGHVQATPQSFYFIFGGAQITGLISIILVNVWNIEYLGGYNWLKPSTRFNYHPLFMIIGFIYLSGNGMVVYRLLRREPKPILKKIHAALNGLGLLFAIIGAVSVFSFHNYNEDAKGNLAPIPNMYSLHSWVGLLVLILYAGQFTAGLTAFLYPGMPGAVRSAIMPFHVFGGTAIFGLAVVACISGITEKAFFVL